jgi:hypothetical protein
MKSESNPEIADFNEVADITDVIGKFPYRLALAGGWIDQPFVSRVNPTPPGSMVVVSLEPTFRFMDRCGIASSTRQIAQAIWDDRLPEGDPEALVRELYAAENEGKAEPSGSQDMAGLIYPGISRLDYDYAYQGGVFPCHVESNNDPEVARWLEGVLHIVPVAPRPEGYNPLGIKNLEVDRIQRLGQTGKDCYAAILSRDVAALGAALNECMLCWEAILPHTVRHPTITTDLMGVMRWYQARYAGAMYSGCGGGYLFVVAEEGVPGAFHATIRLGKTARR